ncbi:uncharacterized protein RHOBADRAFT_51836 [Rhodotorula graminis WP1]|uniref:Uncharacterized protein n=1 Tax=Rhodotorula graminis (strain WP1) TaxID=578459 RepID=A0A194S8P6_RHOGW|nr:uncharacterized protein RHOBADRAFT_51836 [Rhodotorula graminis WP1]KPV76850.1 hypothetical protein RHOBADRAFT_51836 [Rhodotorula graminis WP1]
MSDRLSDTLSSLELTASDSALDLALVLSALESSTAPNSQDVADELQSLAAIYDNPEPSLSLYRPPRTARTQSPPREWTPSSADPLRLVLSTTLAPPHEAIPLHLLLSLPRGYPADEPPLLQLQDRYLGSFAVGDSLFGEVLRTYMHDAEAGVAGAGVEWTGGVCLFEGVELVFVGHAAKVNSLEEVDAVMDSLLSNSKIARATHNISAYQFTTEGGTRHADNDDDGESAAGSRLAHLLTLLDVSSVMVVVTRWYGGVHLGPDRFKDINQAARDALVDAGFLPDPEDKKGKGGGAKGGKRR